MAGTDNQKCPFAKNKIKIIIFKKLFKHTLDPVNAGYTVYIVFYNNTVLNVHLQFHMNCVCGYKEKRGESLSLSSNAWSIIAKSLSKEPRSLFILCVQIILFPSLSCLENGVTNHEPCIFSVETNEKKIFFGVPQATRTNRLWFMSYKSYSSHAYFPNLCSMQISLAGQGSWGNPEVANPL